MSTKASLHDLCRLTKQLNFFYTPSWCMAWKKLRHGIAENFSSPRKKIWYSSPNPPFPIKFYKISKNNSIFILLIQNKGVSLQRNSKQQNNNHKLLAFGHWRSSEIQTKNKTLNNAQIKSAQPSNMTHKEKPSDKTRSRRRIAAGS